MKKIIAALLALWLATEQQPLRSQGVNTPVCLTVLVLAAAGGAMVVISMCRPSYRCLSDPDQPGTNWCSTMTRTAAYSSGFECGPINYKSYKKCMSHCVSANGIRGAIEPDPEWIVSKSTDLKTWIRCGKMEITYNGEIEFKEAIPAGQAQCFYKVEEVYEQPADLAPKPAQPSVQGAKFKLLTAPAPAN